MALTAQYDLGKSPSHHQPHHFGVDTPCSYPSLHLTLTTAPGLGRTRHHSYFTKGDTGEGGLSHEPAGKVTLQVRGLARPWVCLTAHPGPSHIGALGVTGSKGVTPGTDRPREWTVLFSQQHERGAGARGQGDPRRPQCVYVCVCAQVSEWEQAFQAEGMANLRHKALVGVDRVVGPMIRLEED